MPVTFAGINYDDTGDGAEAVVFLHGVTLDRRMWGAQVDHLAATHRCLAVDRRGHGLSAPLSEGWDPIADLADVLDEAEIERCHLVGMSLGGLDAVAAAARIPERLRSLVLVDAWMPIEAMGTWSAPFALAREQGADVARRAWLADPLFAPARALPSVAERITEIVAANDLSTFTGPSPRGLGRAVVAAAASIATPTLVVVGDLDLPEFLETARWLAATIPGAGGRPVAVVTGAGHMLPMEMPEALNALLRTWLETAGEAVAPAP
jgi:pimeloyl-ACP methyl ester carboxylesterase